MQPKINQLTSVTKTLSVTGPPEVREDITRSWISRIKHATANWLAGQNLRCAEIESGLEQHKQEQFTRYSQFYVRHMGVL